MNQIMCLAELGWTLVPAKPASKEALIPWHLALTDPVAVRRWLKTSCNWMVCLGDRIAIDVENDQGDSEVRKIVRERGLPLCPMALTGGVRGGYHLYMRAPEGRQVRNHLRLSVNLEVRTGPLLLTVPPSLHADTHWPYRWEAGRAPWEIETPEAPEWLLAMMVPPPEPERRPVDLSDVGERYVQTAIKGELDVLLRAPKGQRNETLNRAGYSLFRLAEGRPRGDPRRAARGRQADRPW